MKRGEVLMAAKNRLTLFTPAGIADVQRQYEIAPGEEPTPITLIVQKEYLADVVGSVEIFGSVRLKEPVSYPQENQDRALTLDKSNARESLLTQLVGARIRFSLKGAAGAGSDALEGINLGLEPRTEIINNGNARIVRQHVVLQDGSSITLHALDQIERLEFTEEKVRAEIGKAVHAAFSQITPDAAPVSFSLVPEGGETTTALIRYVVPFAVPVPTFRLVQTTGENGESSWMLEGHASCHNETDESFEDCLVTIATGDPHTFEKLGLAEATVPARRVVDLVRRMAQGGTVLEEGFGTMYGGLPRDDAAPQVRYMRAAAPIAAAMGGGEPAPVASFGKRADDDVAFDEMMLHARVAQEEAIGAEIGDFSVWTARNALDIPARRSFLVPLFQREIGSAREVLLYQYATHPERASRAVRFTNELSQTLGKGNCYVYTEGYAAGEGVLNQTSPGQTAYLIHATESGVRVRFNAKRSEPSLAAIAARKGLVTQQIFSRATTTYEVENHKDESFELVVEHENAIPDSKHEISTGTVLETLKNGLRVSLSLPEKGRLTVSVTESRLDSTDTYLARETWPELYGVWKNLRLDAETKRSLDDIMEVQQRVADKEAEIAAARETIQAMDETNKRLLTYLQGKAAGGEAQVRKWQDQIAANEEKISAAEQSLPQLEKEREAALAQLRKVMREATFSLTMGGSEAEV
jgi:hypothetical protein